MTPDKQEIFDARQLYSGLIRLHHAGKEEIFGLGMIEELARHGYKLSPGTLYPILHGLEDNGLLRSHEQSIGGKIRRVYRATSAGEKVLIAAKEKVRELFGELFEDEDVTQLPRTRSRLVALQAANYRRQSTAKVAL